MPSAKANITPRRSVYDLERKGNKIYEANQKGCFDRVHSETFLARIEKCLTEEHQQQFHELFDKYKQNDPDDSLILHVLREVKHKNVPSQQSDIDDVLSFIEDTLSKGNFPCIPESADIKSMPDKCNKSSVEQQKGHIDKQSKPPVSFFWLISVCAIGVCAIGCVLSAIFNSDLPNSKADTIHETNNIKEWEKNIIDLQKKFPSQIDQTWFSIRSGVKTIVTEKPAQPSVFLLLHNDKKTSACLAHTVGKEAVKLLSNSSQEPLIIKGEDLKMNKSLIEDYGLFTETHKLDIERKHVMIILELQEIPAVLAQTFHALCDVDNPLVRDAAFLFTMKVDDDEKLKPTAIAEKNLKLLWKDSLAVDIMEPLITRVTNEVLSVNEEAHLPC